MGGGTGSGKTTVARALACRHGLRLFRIDDFWYDHDARLREPKPTPDEQWLAPPEEQAAEFEATSRRRFALVLEDLATLPPQPPILVEGPQVLPDLLPREAHGVFLVPTQELQRSLLERRPLPPTANPRLALENRIEKDRLYARRLEALAAERGFPVIAVDGSRSVAEDVERVLAPVLAAGGDAELGPARRWENEVFARNVRSWLASPDVVAGVPERYPFACECGRRGCCDQVRLSLDEFDAAAAVVADGHA